MISVNHLLVLSLSIILNESGVSMHNPFYCYSQDPIRPQQRMFGILTGYESVRGDDINPNVSMCKPSRFWLFHRHGTRTPNAQPTRLIQENSERLQSQILSNYDKGRTKLCASDIELIKNWRLDPNITQENAGTLVSAGWNETKKIAQRYQAAFPSILSSTYRQSEYFFRSSYYHTTRASIRAFADGLFGVNGHEQVQFEAFPELPTPDYLLRPYDHCPLHIKLVSSLPEPEAFADMPEYEEVRSQVSAKLGFHGSHVLTAADIETLLGLCRYEQTWYLNDTAPFCAAFSVANHEVLDYYGDLFYYYYNGYGQQNYRRLYENLVCFLMQDLMLFLQSNDDTDHKARIFNAHLSGILHLFVNLGVFEDNTLLTRHNFAQQAHRLFKNSLINPMASNLAVIRYDCADGDNDILFLYNERPLQIAGCEPNGVCKQSLILNRFRRFLDADCMEIFCSNY